MVLASQGGGIVPQSAKLFATRLNQCLDDMGVPAYERERTVAFSKMMDIPRQQAWSLLQGQQMPDAELLQSLANEFEVDPLWLLGEK